LLANRNPSCSIEIQENNTERLFTRLMMEKNYTPTETNRFTISMSFWPTKLEPSPSLVSISHSLLASRGHGAWQRRNDRRCSSLITSYHMPAPRRWLPGSTRCHRPSPPKAVAFTTHMSSPDIWVLAHQTSPLDRDRHFDDGVFFLFSGQPLPPCSNETLAKLSDVNRLIGRAIY